MEPLFVGEHDSDVVHLMLLSVLEDRLNEDKEGLHALRIWYHPELGDEGIEEFIKILKFWDVRLVLLY
jgi:hypothetical protein